MAPLRPPRPQVIVTEQTDPITPSDRAVVPSTPPEPVRRRDRVITLGIAGVTVFFVGWLAVDAAGWVSAAFERSATLGVLAATAVTAGVAGAGVVIAREVVSLFRLKNVEEIHRRFADEGVAPAAARQAIADVLAVVPREREIEAAIEVFQRQVQLHHSTGQQVELLSRTVMKPLDRRAEAHVRTAVLRAFGITAISPTALTDAVFFLACGVRMVRGIAASYGHRPTAATTIHLLRRLVLEAGKLGAVDIATTSLMQHLGGAVTERLATSAADALYAAYRMARLGIIVMDLCRPIPFAQDDVPSVASLVANVLRRRSDPRSDLPDFPAAAVDTLTIAGCASNTARGCRSGPNPHSAVLPSSICQKGIDPEPFSVERIVGSGRDSRGQAMTCRFYPDGISRRSAFACSGDGIFLGRELLIARIAAGDQLAMRTLFARYRSPLFRWMHSHRSGMRRWRKTS